MENDEEEEEKGVAASEARKSLASGGGDADDVKATTPSERCWTVVSTPYTGEPSARGLAANRRISRGEIVEVAHCVVLRDYPFLGDGDDSGDDVGGDVGDVGDDGDDEKTSPSKGDVGGKGKSSRGRGKESASSSAMGLEHYVFFDRRGRSSCCSRRRRRRRRSRSCRDGDGPSSPSPSPPPPPPPSVRVLLALGAGSLFNHSSLAPNVDWRCGTVDSRRAPLVRGEGEKVCCWPDDADARGGVADAKDGDDDGDGHSDDDDDDDDDDVPGALWPVITFYAARDIEVGEELTISYGKPWWEEEDEEEDEEEEDDGSSVEARRNRREGGKKKKMRPTHSHMDDEDAFLGAMTLGGDDDE